MTLIKRFNKWLEDLFGLPQFSSFDERPQIFLSASSDMLQASTEWVLRLGELLGPEFQVQNDDFRMVTVDMWAKQFDIIRRCHAMVVLLDPSQWTSLGQDVEVDDAMGRGMPIALCRVAPFERILQENWQRISGKRESLSPSTSVFVFDLTVQETKRAELQRLLRWVKKHRRHPIAVPTEFKSGEPTEFRASIRIPNDEGWQHIDWSLHPAPPKLVFNYGRLFTRREDKLGWQFPERRQVIVDVEAREMLGEVRAQVLLPMRGFGHVVLTTDDARPDYTRCSRDDTAFLWWDFFVDGASPSAASW